MPDPPQRNLLTVRDPMWAVTAQLGVPSAQARSPAGHDHVLSDSQKLIDVDSGFSGSHGAAALPCPRHDEAPVTFFPRFVYAALHEYPARPIEYESAQSTATRMGKSNLASAPTCSMSSPIHRMQPGSLPLRSQPCTFVRLVPVRSARLRSAPDKLAPDRLAPAKSAAFSSAPDRFTSVKSASTGLPPII